MSPSLWKDRMGPHWDAGGGLGTFLPGMPTIFPKICPPWGQLSPHQGSVRCWELLPQSISWGLNSPSLHPGILWDLFLNPVTPAVGRSIVISCFSQEKCIHQVGKLSLKMDQGFGTGISFRQLGTEGYQESTATSSFISYPKYHEFGKRRMKFFHSQIHNNIPIKLAFDFGQINKVKDFRNGIIPL